MYCTLVKLPRPTKEYVTNLHWCDVAFNRVFIGANLEGDFDLVLDLEAFIVTKLMHLIWVGVFG